MSLVSIVLPWYSSRVLRLVDGKLPELRTALAWADSAWVAATGASRVFTVSLRMDTSISMLFYPMGQK